MYLKQKVFISLIIVSLIFSITNTSFANEAESIEHGVGLNVGLGGYIFSYKHFLSPQDALQFTGGGYFSSKDEKTTTDYSLGFMYQRTLHEGNNLKLLLAPGGSINRQKESFEDESDSISQSSYSGNYYLTKDNYRSLAAGLTIGLEYLPDSFDQIGVAGFAGYNAKAIWDYDNRYFDSREEALAASLTRSYNISPTANFSVMYYF